VFGINGGEKGILFKYQGQTSGIDIWSAFYDDQDYARGMAAFSDSFNQVAIPLYRMDVDLRDAATGPMATGVSRWRLPTAPHL
jgi:hypothetical protein